MAEMLLKADKLRVPEKGAGVLSDALAEKFRIRNEKEVLGMAALATDIGLDDRTWRQRAARAGEPEEAQ